MRLLLSLTVLFMLLAAQSALAPRVALYSARPDWLLIAVMYLALHAPPMRALGSAWVIGFSADLLTLERTGLLALSYFSATLLIVTVRDYLFRQHPVTLVMTVLIVSIPLRSAWLVYRSVLYGPAQGWAAEFATDCVWGAVYTAFWSALSWPVCSKLARPLGLSGARYSHAGLHQIRHARV